MKHTIRLTTASLALAGALTAAPAMAGLEGNIGVASNYIWRGVTQTNDGASVSGGLDYSTDAGFYVGTWTSNVDFGGGDVGYELDLYGGYGMELGGVSIDLGYIYFAYPSQDDSDFSEVYANFGFGAFNAGVAYQVDADSTDENYLYLSLGADFDLGNDYGVSIYGGNYDFGDDGDDLTHFGVSLSKGDFGIALDKNDSDDDDPRVTVSWSKTF